MGPEPASTRTDPASQKLSASLTAAYAAKENSTLIVFLQPAWEVEQVGATHGSGPGIYDLDGLNFRPVADSEVVQRNEVMRSRLTVEIAAVTGRAPRYLNILGAFVFAATLDQAKALASSSDVLSLDLSGVQAPP